MLLKRIRNIGRMALCTPVILLLAGTATAEQKTLEPELTGTLTFDASTRTKVGGTIQSLVLTIGDGGTGQYKSVMLGDPSLPTHTIYRPKDLSPFGKKNALPIITWANGACMNTSTDWRNLLSEIASHGFIVIAIGPAASSATGYHDGETSTSQLIEAIDWAEDENANPDSPYYQKIDTGKVAVMGMSCGGLQALEASLDPRVTTSIIWNSGVFGQRPATGDQPGGTPGAAPGEGPSAITPGETPGGTTQGAAAPAGDRVAAPSGVRMPTIDFSKNDLQRLHAPILYITGTKDIALENAKDDFSRITKVPVFLAVKNGAEHHDATYQKPNAGDYGVYGTAWLKWHLKGDKGAASVFEGKDCTLCKDAGWSVQKKNIE